MPMKVLTKEEALGVLRFLVENQNGLGFEKPTFRTENWS